MNITDLISVGQESSLEIDYLSAVNHTKMTLNGLVCLIQTMCLHDFTLFLPLFSRVMFVENSRINIVIYAGLL